MNERTLRHKMVDIEADINDVARDKMLDATNQYVKTVNVAKEKRKTVLQRIRKERKQAIKDATEKLYAEEATNETNETDENTNNEE